LSGNGATAEGETRGVARVVDFLRDAVVELEVWRQNARSPDERHALQRLSALLGQAAAELRNHGAGADPAQQTLHLTEPSS
jgi:hypothetical protein